MQCPRCQFENLPGQTRCFKCGSVLASPGGAIAIEPPRMAAWKRPFRSMSKSFRGLMPTPRLPRDRTARPSYRGESLMAVESLGSLVFGLVPGLPYVLTGQFKRIRLLWLAWLVLFCLGAFFYGLPEGWTLIGLAAAAHAWMMFRHRVLEVLEGFGERIVTLLVLVLILLAAYVWLPRLMIPGLACIRSNTSVPFYRILTGDALLVRRAPEKLSRGMIVVFRAHTYFMGRRGGALTRARDTDSLGQIVGLPGEVVEIRGNAFAVNGQALDPNQYPVPRWMQGRHVTVNLDQGQYFVSCDYWVPVRPAALDNNAIQQVCVASHGEIESRAVWLWSPLSRRGPLRAD